MLVLQVFFKTELFSVRDFLKIAQRICPGAISRNPKFARLDSSNQFMDRLVSVFGTLGLIITFELSF